MFDSRNDPLMDRFIADLVEGAERNSRANGGPGVNVLVHKFANHAALGAGLGGVLLPGIGAPIGAAIGADKGQGLSAAGGSILGGLGGGLAGTVGGGGLGALIGALAGNPGAGATIGAGAGGALGGLGGLLYGAHRGGEKESIGDKLSSAAHEGAKTAAARFGIKEAFWPALLAGAARLAPMAARAGGFLAKNPIGQQIAGTAASNVVNRVMQPKQPQPGMMG